jgi:predicted alpha-1,2-mannosidase
MMKFVLYFFICGLFFACSSKQNSEGVKSKQTEDLTKYVDPFIGTGYHGHTFPGPALPFGQIQLSPDNGTEGWDWSSGYHYSDSLIAGFSHTHLSGTGIGDLSDILMMPTTKDINTGFFVSTARVTGKLKSKFRHADEKAEAGYYKVSLLDDNINVELAVTKRVGFQRYSFPEGRENKVVIDLGFAINTDNPVETFIIKRSDTEIVGYRYSEGWAKNQHVYFVTRFSSPFRQIQIYDAVISDSLTGKGKNIKAVLNFGAASELIVKTSISSASIEAAMKNMDADKNGFEFDHVVAEAKEEWNRELGKITAKTQSNDLKTIFYTALYHTFLSPYTFSDVDGSYKDYNDQPAKITGFTKYTVLSLWDTFRALNPLFTITQPGLSNDIIKSMLLQYEQTGLLPVWELMGNETGTMIGYHSIPVITDAIMKNTGDFDIEKAYEAMKKSAMSNLHGLDLYRSLKYIPSDKENESVSKTLEYCYDDWCIAQAAKKLGKIEEHEYYMERSEYYKNVFDKKTGFMRGKLLNGKWAEPFDPKFSKHQNDYFTEGNGWQWTWFVPQDVKGLSELFGGDEAFVLKLDQLFTESSEIKGEAASIDISGMIGQYAHGNEPSHSTVYLYEVLNKDAWKTQKLVNQVLTTLYSSKPEGLSGNEDCGQMSAWYVFSSAGFYPVRPGDNRYYFASPLFDELTFNLSEGKTFTVKSINLSSQNIYIRSATLNGKKLDRLYITHEEIMQGGELDFEMSDKH